LAERRLSADEVRRLYDRHGPALVLYARSYLADVGSAEDVVHGVFLKLLRGREVALEMPAAYLYRAVKNAVMNARRDRQRDTPLPESEPWFRGEKHDLETILALQREISQLTEDQREVVIMRIWSGMTLEEVAEATGVSVNTAASRYRYAIAKLRERLRPHEELAKEGDR